MNSENQDVQDNDRHMKFGESKQNSDPSKAYEAGVLKNLRDTIRSVNNPRNAFLKGPQEDPKGLNLSKSELLNLLNR